MPHALALAPSTPSTPSVPATRLLLWLGDAVRMLRAAPLRILLLAFAPILFEALCQALPHVGIVLSKLLTPLAGGFALMLLHGRVRHGAFAPVAALRTCIARSAAMAGVAALSALVFVVQLGVAAAVAGGDQALAIASGDMAALCMSRSQLALMLASGLVPGLALMTVTPRVLLGARGLRDALADNAAALLRAWKPVGLAMLLTAAMLAALPWQPAILLLLVPFGLTVGYAMYRDLFPDACD